jgi:hypothetical protein
VFSDVVRVRATSLNTTRWFFTHIFTGDLIFKGLTARRLYKSFGVLRVKGDGYLKCFSGLIRYVSSDVLCRCSPQVNEISRRPTLQSKCFLSLVCLC